MTMARGFSSPLRGEVRHRARAKAVALLAFLPAVLLAGGCGIQPVGTPKEIVKKAVAAQGALKSVSMGFDSEVEITVPGSQRSADVSYHGVYQKPDRWRLKVRASGARSEIIIMGDRTFVKLPGSDAWIEKKGDMLQDSSSPGELLSSKYLASATDVKLLDRKGDTYNLGFNLDLGSFARSFNLTGADPSMFKGRKARMEVWVLKDSMRVKKATMGFDGDLAAAGPGKLKMDMEVEFSDFNEPVSIEPPTLGAQ